MSLAKTIFVIPIAFFFAATPYAKAEDFSGIWSIDLRSKVERQQNQECGKAYFSLNQVGDRVSGEHVFATVDCSRLNEGYKNSVKGIVIGSTAILVVTSSRTGAIIMGRAVKKNHLLYWTSLDQIAPGQPDGDSPLILDKGILHLKISNNGGQLNP